MEAFAFCGAWNVADHSKAASPWHLFSPPSKNHCSSQGILLCIPTMIYSILKCARPVQTFYPAFAFHLAEHVVCTGRKLHHVDDRPPPPFCPLPLFAYQRHAASAGKVQLAAVAARAHCFPGTGPRAHDTRPAKRKVAPGCVSRREREMPPSLTAFGWGQQHVMCSMRLGSVTMAGKWIGRRET